MTTSNNSPEACAAYPDARPEEESVNFPWVGAHNARQEHFRNVFDAGRAMQRDWQETPMEGNPMTHSAEAIAAYPDDYWRGIVMARALRTAFDVGRALQREADEALVLAERDRVELVGGRGTLAMSVKHSLGTVWAAIHSSDSPTPSTTLESAFFPGLSDQLDALTIRKVDQ